MVSYTLKDIHNDQDYLPSLLRTLRTEDQKDARIGEAEAKRDAKIREPEASRKRCLLVLAKVQ